MLLQDTNVVPHGHIDMNHDQFNQTTDFADFGAADAFDGFSSIDNAERSSGAEAPDPFDDPFGSGSGASSDFDPFGINNGQNDRDGGDGF
jgi:hypothetical protein